MTNKFYFLKVLTEYYFNRKPTKNSTYLLVLLHFIHSTNHLLHFLHFLTHIEQCLSQLHLTVWDFIELLIKHLDHVVVGVEGSTYFKLKRLQIELEVAFSLLSLGLENGLKSIFLVFETDYFELIFGEFVLYCEYLVIDLL